MSWSLMIKLSGVAFMGWLGRFGFALVAGAVVLSSPLAVGAASAPVAVNLLSDGGFEGPTIQPAACTRVQGRLPMAWADNSCWNANTAVTYDQEALTGRQGKSVKVTLARGLFQLAQSVQLPPDARFMVSVWVRASTPMMVKVALRQSGAPYIEYGSRLVRATDQWQKIAVSAFSHGLNEADARQALFMVSSATPGTMWMDDAVLTAEPQALAFPKAEVPRTFFGTHVLHGRNMTTFVDESEAGAIRIWDSESAQWAFVQTEAPSGGRRSYQWRSLDDRVGVAERNQRELLMVLGGYAPAWASLPEGADDSAPLGNNCFRCDETPRRSIDWRNWVTDVGKRFKGRAIRYWEIWNEPAFNQAHDWCPDLSMCTSGLGSGYRGSPEQLLQLQNEAAEILKGIDAKAKVVSPGISYFHREYLDYYLKIGGGKSADVIGYHQYLAGYPELLMSQALAIRSLMADAGVGDKPLWSTESAIEGINLDLDPACKTARAAGVRQPTVEELGPAYWARFMLVSWISGYGRVYHYAWDLRNHWPSTPSKMSPQSTATLGLNAAGIAYNQVATWMIGKRVTSVETGNNGGLWRLSMVDAAGKPSQVVWLPAQPKAVALSLKLPSEIKSACDLSGSCRAVPRGAPIDVDFRPVLLTP